MPVLQTIGLVKSPPTNCYGLVQYLAQRVPGYDPSEYLRELNAAYVHVWEEISKLKNHYFENIKTVTVTTAGYNFDLMFNTQSLSNSGLLSSAISSRLYQITKIRIQPPAGGLFQTTAALSPNHPDFIAVNANASSTPTQTGPYYWYPSGRAQVNWGLPLAVGTTMEVTYTFWLIQLNYMSIGAVSSTTNAVTGTSTTFTQIVQPDFQAYLPAIGAQEEIQAELVCNPGVTLGGQLYRVSTITSDTVLTTASNITPTLASGSPYVLATLPEIPREHIRVVASIALAAMYSVAGDDARVGEWTAKSQSNLQMMKDALIERQSNTPAQKIRNPYGIARRNRAFLR
jgi:hypothetical protein